MKYGIDAMKPPPRPGHPVSAPGITRDLAARVVHEIRSPMGVISQTLAELSSSVGDGTDAAYLRLARRSLDRLGRLAERLDWVTRITGDGLEVDATPATIRDVVEQATTRARRFAGRTAVALETAGDDGAGVRVDASQACAAALEELVHNALRHARSGVQLEVDAARPSATVTVSHDGPQLSADERVFEPRCGRASGLGIGLWLARTLAQAVGGDVTLDPSGALRLSVPVATGT